MFRLLLSVRLPTVAVIHEGTHEPGVERERFPKSETELKASLIQIVAIEARNRLSFSFRVCLHLDVTGRLVLQLWDGSVGYGCAQLKD